MWWWCTVLGWAGGLTPRTSRHPLPNREVERPVVLPSGWTELDLSFDHSPTFSADEASLLLRHGFSPRMELWWLLPAADVQWGGQTRRMLLDPSFGARFLLHRREAPARSIAVEVAYQADFSPDEVVSLDTGEDLAFALCGRQQWGGLLFDAGLGGGTAGHVDAALETLIQAGPLASGLRVEHTAWPGADPAAWPDRVRATELRVRALAHPTRGVDAELHWTLPLAERGLEPTDLARRPLRSMGGRLGVRW